MLIDATINITFECEEQDLKDFAEAMRCYDDEDEAEDIDLDEVIIDYLQDALDGEEIQCHSGRAWVCNVDDGSIIEK